MFEIGSTLRDARVRRDLSLQQAEADTKIRVKYIQAMENEDFDVLPGGTYVKGFLRTYAQYLGLDYQLVLDEYNHRFGNDEQREHLIVQTGINDKNDKPSTRSGKPRKQTNYLFVAIFAIVIIAVLAYLGWGNSSSEKATLITTNTIAETTSGQVQTEPAAEVPAPAPETTPTQTQPPDGIESLVLTADVEESWVRVRKDSSSGEIIWEGLLSAGDIQTFTFTLAELPNQKLVLNVGAPLLVEVNGQSQRLETGIYSVTPTSIAELP